MTEADPLLRVAVVGAGPAGIYASDALMKSGVPVSIDLYEKMPAPFGLIRYGVAPDHPRIKGIVKSLHQVLDKPQIRLIGHVEFGKDIDIDFLSKHYHAVIFSTGAVKDRGLDIPGVGLDGSYGAAEFVGWYDPGRGR
jgi:ferredoxin--NADP+ reductase